MRTLAATTAVALVLGTVVGVSAAPPAAEVWTTPDAGPSLPPPVPSAVSRPQAPVRPVAAPPPEYDFAPRRASPACRAGFDAWARYWAPVVEGKTFITLGGEPGTATWLDAEGDLDLERGNAFEVGLSWAFGGGRHRLVAAYEDVRWEGASRLGDDEIFRGTPFPAGTKVDSELSFRTLKAGYDYAWLCRPGCESRVGAQAWVWRYEQSLDAVGSDLSRARDFTHVMPMLTLSTDGWLGAFRLGGSAAFGWIGDDRMIADLEARLGVRLWDRVTIDLGWKWRHQEFRETTNLADLTWHGPFLQVEVDF